MDLEKPEAEGERKAGRLMLGAALAMPFLQAAFVTLNTPIHDEVLYSESAFHRAIGTFRAADISMIYDTRVGLTVPLSFLYRAFDGPSANVNSILPLFMTVIVVLLAYRFGSRLFGTLAGGAAALLVMMSGHFLFYTRHMFPDVPLSAALLAVVYLIWEGRRATTPLLGCALMAAAGLAWNVAFTFKETIFAVAPVLALVALWDLRNKRGIGRWLVFAATALGLVVLHLHFYKVLTGSYFKRFEIMEGIHNRGQLEIIYHSLGAYLHRLLLGFLAIVLGRPGVIVEMAFAAPFMVGLFWKRAWPEIGSRERDLFLPIVCVGTIAFYWFGTSSPKHFIPVLVDYRNILPMCSLVAPLAGGTLAYLWRLGGEAREAALQRARPQLVIIFSVFVAGLCIDTAAFFIPSHFPGTLRSASAEAVAVLAAVGVWAMLRRRAPGNPAPTVTIAKGGLIAAFGYLAVTLATGADMYRRPAEHAYTRLFNDVAGQSPPALLYAPDAPKDILHFLSGYSDKRVEVQIVDDLALARVTAAQGRRTYLLFPLQVMQGGYKAMGQTLPPDVEAVFEHPPANWKLVDDSLGVRLYEVSPG